MQEPIALVSAAADFAARRHAGQTMRGRRKRPYVNHLAEVAALVAASPAGRDAELIAAAWLHDVVEDEHAGSAEIAATFGERVSCLVEELTDDMTLAEAERRRLQVLHVAGKSRDARLLKLADKISKVRELVEDPPAEWSPERRRDYVAWCIAVVDAGCRGLDPGLEQLFDEAVRATGV